jgi:N-acetylmuramoyl-L-alanine amidase CwlA
LNNYKLTQTTIGLAKVIVDILPKGKVIPNTKMTPTSITIHNTGNIGAPAKNNHNYMKNCNKNGDRIASWHFTVDDKEIYQAVPTNYKAYHAGNATGNATSIGIEICMFNNAERQKQAYLNAIELVKILMKAHGLGISQVKQHYNWTRKDCPTWLRSGKFGYDWKWFTTQCAGHVAKSIPTPTPAPTAEFKPYIARCTTDGLNCRKGPGTTYTVERQINKGTAITIVDQKMVGSTKWLKAKSGYWVSANYMEFVRYV